MVTGVAGVGALGGEAVAAALAVMSSTSFWMSTEASSSFAGAGAAGAAGAGAASGAGATGVCFSGSSVAEAVGGVVDDGMAFDAEDGDSEGLSELLACSDGDEVAEAGTSALVRGKAGGGVGGGLSEGTAAGSGADGLFMDSEAIDTSGWASSASL